MDEYGAVYREASTDGQWLAISLVANSQREGDGATRLWSLAASATDDDVRNLLKRHAVDESHHSLEYLRLLDLVFPDSVSATFRAELGRLSPHYALAQPVVAVDGSPYAHLPGLDDFVQMNIAEIRTTIHHTLQREAVALHCPAANRLRADRILDSLLRDEVQHVAYTADLIERAAPSTGPERLSRLFCTRVCDFNAITTRELASATFTVCATCGI
jgi:hypothetical protein